MFCSKCGTKQGVGEKFCPKCGNPFTENPNANENKVSIVDNLKAKADEVANYAKGPLAEKVKTTVEQACIAAEPMAKKVAEQVKSTVGQIQSELKDENNNSDIADNQSVVKGKWNIKKILWGIVSFFIPLVGLIFFFVKKKDNLPMAKFALCCAAVGFIFNTITYLGGESDDYEDEYYESSYENNSSTSSSKELWEDCIGKWEYNIVLEPDGYSTVVGYGGSIYLTINGNGTANLKVTSAELGREKTVINTSGKIIMNGSTLSIAGTSVQFTINGGRVYTSTGDSMNRKY